MAVKIPAPQPYFIQAGEGRCDRIAALTSLPALTKPEEKLLLQPFSDLVLSRI